MRYSVALRGPTHKISTFVKGKEGLFLSYFAYPSSCGQILLYNLLRVGLMHHVITVAAR